MKHSTSFTAACLLCLLALLPLSPRAEEADDGLAQRVAGPWPEQVRIPFVAGEPGGSDMPPILMLGHVFKPVGAGPFPVMIFSHGRAGQPQARADLSKPITRAHASYWLDKGIAVVAPIRPGYGDTGGPDREFSGAHVTADGKCGGQTEFGRVAANAAQAMRATLDWVREQPWADAERIVLEGQSVGGLTTVALAASKPPGVIGYINFAGGHGGDALRLPGRPCGVEDLTQVFETLGKTTQVPGLWLYAANDLYWGARAPAAWHAAFAQGGSPSRFVMTPPLPDGDGHSLLLRGRALWRDPVEQFLAELKLL